MPVGGAPEVIKIYNNLNNYLSDKEVIPEINGKIFCLIDTDKETVDISKSNNSKLIIKRLLLDDDAITLESTTSKKFNPPTEIENCLNAYQYIETLQTFSKTDVELNPLIKENKITPNKIYSGSVLDLTLSEISIVKTFFNKNEGDNKILFAHKYTELARAMSTKKQLDWIQEIYNYFN